MAKQRILHISKFYFPYVGGIEDVCFNIVKSLKNMDVEQMVVCFNDKNQYEEDVIDDVKVVRVPMFKQIMSQPITIKYRIILKRILKDFAPTIVHFHYPNPFIAAVLLSVLPDNIKLITHWHSDIIAQKITYKFVKPFEKRLVRRSNSIVVTSPQYLEYSKPLADARSKAIILPNVINVEKYSETTDIKSKVEELKNSFDGKKIIFTFGRHVPYKGFEYLIKAVKQLSSEYVLVIGGKGPLSESLKNMASDNENVKFIGRVSNEDLPVWLYAASVFAFPSITKNEAFGVALAEAMYCYSPAVTFSIEGSGVNWVNIDKQTGVEVPNRDIKLYASALDELLLNDDVRNKYANQAHDRVVELFTPDIFTNSLPKIYDI